MYTENDGTEIDEDAFPEIEAGCTLICAKKNEVWLPPEKETASNNMSATASMAMTSTGSDSTINITSALKSGNY